MTSAKVVLHVVSSASFMNFTAGVFEEAAPGRNVFALASGVDAHALRLPSGVPVETADAGRLAELVATSAIAVFHGVTAAVAPVLAQAPASTLRVWSGWGGDYYGTAVDRFAHQLAPGTAALVRHTYRPTIWVSRVRSALRHGPVLAVAARASDLFSAPIPQDLSVFQRRFRGFRGGYHQLNYASVEDSLATDDRRPVGRDILVGNSATPPNNHVEQFRLLAEQDLEGRRVVVPLSYGDPDYRDLVIAEGHRLLGSHFAPLVDFMPLADYNEVLADCGTVILGSWRQLGMGNILRALWQGAHLVLDRRNPTLRYLRDGGVTVSTTDEVSRDGLPAVPLTAAQIADHHAFLTQHWGRATVVRNAAALVARV